MRPALLILIVLSFFSMDTVAQNWSLVRPNDTLVYERQQDNQFFTVWVDSTEINGSETIFHMNRLVHGDYEVGNWDSLCRPDIIAYWNLPPMRYKKWGTQFLGYMVSKVGQKYHVQFDSTEIVINPNLGSGSFWLADTMGNRTMQVISENYELISPYGVMDSTKIIRMGSREWKLSKNHGLLNATDLRIGNSDHYDLRGVQNLKIGETIPMAQEIFDFEVDDRFYYKSRHCEPEGCYGTNFRFTVKSKLVYQDSVVYQLEEVYQPYNVHDVKGPTIIGSEKWVFIYNQLEPLTNALPNTIVVNSQNGSENLVSCYRSSNHGKIEKSNYGKRSNGTSQLPLQVCVFDTFILSYYIDGPNLKYANGLGLIYSSGYHSSYKLVGFSKNNGENWGDVSLTSISEIDQRSFSIYPNPAQDFIIIQPFENAQPFTVELYDIQGRLITTQQGLERLEMALTDLRKGVYFILVKSENGDVQRERIIKN